MRGTIEQPLSLVTAPTIVPELPTLQRTWELNVTVSSMQVVAVEDDSLTRMMIEEFLENSAAR